MSRWPFLACVIGAVAGRTALRRAARLPFWLVIDPSAVRVFELAGWSLAVDALLLLALAYVATRRARDVGTAAWLGALLIAPGGAAFVPLLLRRSTAIARHAEHIPYRSADPVTESWMGAGKTRTRVAIGFVGVTIASLVLPAARISPTDAVAPILLLLAMAVGGGVAGGFAHAVDPRPESDFASRSVLTTLVAAVIALGVRFGPILVLSLRPRASAVILFFAAAGVCCVSLVALLTGPIGRAAVRRLSGR